MKDWNKNKNFQNLKKITGDIIVLQVSKITTTCHVVPRIWCRQGSQLNITTMWRIVLQIWCGQGFALFWAIFGLFPFNEPKDQNFRKIKKTPEDIIILHSCTKNHYMTCSSSGMMRTRICTILGHFCSFPH